MEIEEQESEPIQDDNENQKYTENHENNEKSEEKELKSYRESDNKWYGEPAKGEQPLPGKWNYVFWIFLVIIIEISIWAIYRWSTAELFQSFGTYEFYFFHIIFAPTIHLLPILIFWKYVRRERGHPFIFSTKLLLTGIIVGFTGAIIWRLLEEFIYDGVAGLAGGTVPGTLTFWNLLETADLFMLMTFVMYFIVGPVEELEFRGFTQDQAARVIKNWQALIFSSILFGFSHIPIAVFIYQLSPTRFFDALIGWIAAGFTFGALYMWSRNIYACIVMHGMGNWQLSVFYFSSLPAVMNPTTSMFVGITTSILSNAIMIVIFFIIHKYYWEPHRRGEPAFGGAFQKLQIYLHEHDFGEKPIFNTIMVFVIFIMIISGMIMGAAASFGTPWPTAEATASGGSDATFNLETMDSIEESETTPSHLEEGSTETISINSQPGKYLKDIEVIVTWSDEADRNIRYQNQPDTFRVSIVQGNMTISFEGENLQGGQGTLSTKMSLTNDNITNLFESDGETYGVQVEITLVEAGNQEKVSGLPGLAWTDSGNDFEYTLNIIWLSSETSSLNEEEEN